MSNKYIYIRQKKTHTPTQLEAARPVCIAELGEEIFALTPLNYTHMHMFKFNVNIQDISRLSSKIKIIVVSYIIHISMINATSLEPAHTKHCDF